jgi:signal peptidase I
MKLVKKLVIAFGIIFILLFALFYFTGSFPFNLASRIATDSMDPTLKVGDWLHTDRGVSPKVGDIIEFDCTGDSCKNEIVHGRFIIHRLVSIDPNGCLHIIGDNPKYDWSNVPCYMPETIKIAGVVHKINLGNL